MAQFKYVVFTEPVAGRENEYNDWYTNTHLQDLLGVKGFVAAQRFKIVELDSNSQPVSRYMAIYDIEADDPKTVMDRLADPALAKSMVISTAIDLSSSKTFLYQPITERVVRR